MGRTYFVEEAIGQYLSNLSTKVQPYVTGLLIGQCSVQKDYVIQAVRTPLKEEQKEDTKPSKLASIDEEWITTHASQVSRMLPGGLLVLGVFIITSPELSKDSQNALRKLIFSVEKSLTKRRLWKPAEEEVSERAALQICSATKKVVCRTYDVQDPKSSAKPADWKYQSALSASWLALDCTVNVNIHIPLLATSPNHDLEKNIKNGLNRWAKQIEDSVFLINGQVKDDDAELLEGQKKSRGNTQSTSQISDVKVLTQLSQGSSRRSTATVQVCSGSINLKGAVKCRAYTHNNKPKVKEAIQALKRDIINTLSDRCEILFEDLIINEGPPKKDFEREYHVLPQRLFVPVAGSSVMLSDYRFGEEAVGEIQERFVEMLDQSVQAEDIHIAEEINTVGICPVTDNMDDTQQKQLTKATLLLKLQQNMGVVIAAAVAVFASIFSFNYFSD
ncbi:protein odr-4 homolog isoform X1 [Melopsittacus undulatus]|uniref:Protein odr-4 homolog n=1 Tax=Melopsittacus undulatus TaxID=13146 RepID=A0A8C6JM35_MELUD|nr:protein odr-4 homolog isoform X1 [Melopsittacus undulatus]XP_030902609.1 protein odr-4 homolog isoform X1 [Melopsittacus undulatus]XP_030902610.1 protein odr-4 homolog isoform X1 [Melopsittacus undulatus]XP_030902611.1 protein odr-4 homolog isoform X1 [Melopsittacus undulatus]XP_030902612.1 protein odr-4 homolog isoform X1 [Melopsittacus undulatus]XP_030902614.1 protein odr-4 homolog isoform X1 [Melopsittacus undulatus]